MADKMSALFDASKCTGCQACSVACKQWNELPAEKTTHTGSYQTHQNFTPKTWSFITFNEVWENNKMEWLFLKKQCMHCADAACEKACNNGAISHTDKGFVVIDKQKCIGCGYCVANCPFNVPCVDPKTNKSTKCTGCPERVSNGLRPACVQACQPEALTFGSRDEIMGMAKKRLDQIKPKHPQAMIYNAPKLEGINFTYILLRDPKYYDLPNDPTVSSAISIWKDIIRPAGQLMNIGAIAGFAAIFAVSKVIGSKHNDHHEHQGGGKADANR
ncbi:4Fe-4S dicluster domain-containing protein [Sporomusa malonica]|uniref:Formate dehydrogenase (Quinone-dependent) iron-sulfur subunit n=1 Tax=Sporomusa malonica TaxID=112901 RepID=A0A1W1YGA1_9FIRM|nr:4Fe-4S dicluster domain-containing protein [Sporomusa malonica]SMC35250.1 formate dehydrogenase (quinone-dependent) iron-sulfur subunit [Sporomusa malonica]